MMASTLERFSPAALAGLSARERRLITLGVVVLILVLLFGVIVPLERGVSRERTALAKK
ncbi:MAG: hypothetical protein JOZ03_04975, partial [Gammaproteobacteria bacterium]|nr:hypothetical protein [Gammaproteobacteria bacterium]